METYYDDGTDFEDFRFELIREVAVAALVRRGRRSRTPQNLPNCAGLIVKDLKDAYARRAKAVADDGYAP